MTNLGQNIHCAIARHGCDHKLALLSGLLLFDKLLLFFFSDSLIHIYRPKSKKYVNY